MTGTPLPGGGSLDSQAATLWAQHGLGEIDIVWDNPESIRVKFWHRGKVWVHQGDMLRGYLTSSGVMFTGVLRRKYRN